MAKNNTEDVSEKNSEKIHVFSFIKMKPANLENFLESLKKFPPVKHYYIVTGEFDGVLEIEVNGMGELYDFYTQIEKLEEIDATTTHIVMKKFDFHNEHKNL